MNMPFEEDHDELERQLGAISLVEPGKGYSQIPSRLESHKAVFWWRAWPWVTACLLIATGTIYMLSGNSAVELDFPATLSLESADVENTANVAPVISSVAEVGQSQDNSYVLGTHYNLLPAPVPTPDQAVNEVVAFFWYPCRPCDGFEHSLREWERSLSADTRLTRIPAIWSEQMRFHARAFYTAEVLGVLDRAHPLFFREFDKEPVSGDNEDQLLQFFAQLGISANEFLLAFNSEVTLERLAQAEIANRDYFVQSTPALYVQGRYTIAPTAGGISSMFEIADYLLQQTDADN